MDEAIPSAPPPAPAGASLLPLTEPGLSAAEGVFLVTQAGDGGAAIYFIAQNVAHSILPADMRTEQQLNPLWPVRAASQVEVLAFAESAPIGSARAGLLVAAPGPNDTSASLAEGGPDYAIAHAAPDADLASAALASDDDEVVAASDAAPDEDQPSAPTLDASVDVPVDDQAGD